MARIFISHSSKDNIEAIALRDWLVSEGWVADEIFLDLDDMTAEYWRTSLSNAKDRCEAVIFLLSPASLKSKECYLEVRSAEDLKKPVLAVILPARSDDAKLDFADPRLTDYRPRQIEDLDTEPSEELFTVEHRGKIRTVTFNRDALGRVAARLKGIGIAPDTFVWSPDELEKATPYPGLPGFQRSDAAMFFGRSADLARALGELREVRRVALTTGEGTLYVIQAASGAGKSSFLKAGLWPRLVRDPEPTPVAILRPATGLFKGTESLPRGGSRPPWRRTRVPASALRRKPAAQPRPADQIALPSANAKPRRPI